MIIKQPDKIVSDDKFSKAGYEAEKQMAFLNHYWRKFIEYIYLTFRVFRVFRGKKKT